MPIEREHSAEAHASGSHNQLKLSANSASLQGHSGTTGDGTGTTNSTSGHQTLRRLDSSGRGVQRQNASAHQRSSSADTL